MIQYPLRFEVSAAVGDGIDRNWPATVPGTDRRLTVAIPPEFEGPGGGYSPEDLYGLAMLNCFGATFKVIASRSKLPFAALLLKGTLTVDRDEQGRPWMKAFELTARLQGVGDRERAARLLEKTSQSCIVLNSVKTEKTFRFEVD